VSPARSNKQWRHIETTVLYRIHGHALGKQSSYTGHVTFFRKDREVVLHWKDPFARSHWVKCVGLPLPLFFISPFVATVIRRNA
jgi:hypothetical protein